MKPRTPTKRCNCQRCRVGRRVERIAAGLSKRDGEFILGMFEALMELSAESDMREAARRN